MGIQVQLDKLHHMINLDLDHLLVVLVFIKVELVVADMEDKLLVKLLVLLVLELLVELLVVLLLLLLMDLLLVLDINQVLDLPMELAQVQELEVILLALASQEVELLINQALGHHTNQAQVEQVHHIKVELELAINLVQVELVHLTNLALATLLLQDSPAQSEEPLELPLLLTNLPQP